ncbi:MAG: histidine kinase [Phycisphaerales bacterium]|nr:histidine kinase [Phycisphaerales bacterium]
MTEAFETDLTAVGRIDAVQQILEVVCRTTGLGFSAVARVTESRWVACAVRDEIAFGLKPGGELKLETTICNEIRQSGRVVAIDHVAEDAAYCGHPTPAMYGFQSYISVPITRADGRLFGTLCAIDPRPAKVNTPTTIGMFELFADLIARHIDAADRVAATEAALLNEREASQLREQFIAVLGHDLRNPLAAISSGVDLLNILPHSPDANDVIAMMRRSTARMAALINDVLDFARGRLGGGLAVRRTDGAGLGAAIEQVVTELQSAWPTRDVRREIALADAVPCDANRITQMLSNLLANALTHGDPNGPVWVRARSGGGGFELSVANAGKPIPPHVAEHLFKPFTRGTARPGQQGLGLGLYIAAEIAQAHAGTLGVASTPEETRFTFRMSTA